MYMISKLNVVSMVEKRKEKRENNYFVIEVKKKINKFVRLKEG